jgi:hypothetical protein
VVTIEDENGVPVSGATVTINTNGSTNSGVTGTDGTISLSFSTRSTGSYTSTVTNVFHNDYIWDGIEASAFLQVP